MRGEGPPSAANDRTNPLATQPLTPRTATGALRPATVALKYPAPLPSPSAVSDADVDSTIDASIVGAERETIRKFILLLPPTRRGGNITYTDAAGVIYANKHELKSRLKRLAPAPGKPGAYVDLDGRPFAAPPREKKPATLSPSSAIRGKQTFAPPDNGVINSGAMRRVYTAGYQGEGGYLTLPCRIANNGSQATAYSVYGERDYIYLGGFGDDGTAVDAGLQYSPDNDWYTYFSFTSNGTFEFVDHIACGQQISMGFNVVANNYVDLQIYAYDTGGRLVNYDHGFYTGGTWTYRKRPLEAVLRRRFDF